MKKWYEENLDTDIIVSSRIRLARNYKKYPFSVRLSSSGAEKMIEETKRILLEGNTILSKEFEYIPVFGRNPIDKRALMESHVISPELVKKTIPCGVLLKNDESISIMINEEDHIRIQSVALGMNMSKAWDLADKIDNVLEESIEYAFNEKLGYLTSCPTNVGTGMRASYMMHLPALEWSGQLQNILYAIGKLGITVRGLYGEGTQAEGSLYQISNQITLGQSEKEIIENLNNIALQIAEQEKQIREQILKEKKEVLRDKIYRSYGTLRYARMLTTKEAMTLLSDIKMGFDMGILGEARPMISFYEFIMYVQPAILQKRVGTDLSSQDRDMQRAEFVRSQFER
ncbi:protein arginine kinase [Defluviitalea saccharophila]|uniref:Protein-arginine kinase n=1 Tax=Defluviitalea saccharophila TaxID=879970 RepID=A0ABZ2Y7A2_9FIRM|nr:protein arginine kinase [Candidatus Epulonipiscium sp.]